MKISIPRAELNDVSESSNREWLETNGLGGWASQTLCGSLTRRYHGLLVAAIDPPLKRVVMLSKLDEAILIGEQRHELGTNHYPGAVAPQGFLRMVGFEREFFPTTTFEAGGVVLRRSIAAIHGQNATVISFEVLEAPVPFTLELKPLVAGREYHSLRRANGELQQFWSWKDTTLSFQPYRDGPQLSVGLGLVDSRPGNAPSVFFEQRPDWYHNFEYLAERQRGFDYLEDLFTPGNFLASLRQGDQLTVVATTDPIAPAERERLGNWGRSLVEKERTRRRALIAKAPAPTPLAQRLTLAADQCIVARGISGRTVIAGYHWFGDWGRDTMLSLPGLALATKRFDDAREILSTFANHTKHGLVPNRFRDEDGTAEYNTVDASLWFCWAVDSYRKATQDTELVRRIFYPAVQQIIAAYLAGTDYNIHADTDGLISAGDPSIQLTWMDAKVGSWVVTPRHGKAVEIQALWYNALRVAADLAALFKDPQAERQYRECATHVEKSFLSTFWFEATNCLADCVVGGHVDGSIRPNQIYALSLPYPLLTGDRALSVLKVVEQKLLTPVGLRSLDPSHPDYQAHYRGEPATRDGQYHQGTVWGFLLGAYLSAVIRLRGKDGLQQARKILAGLSAPLQQAGIGTLSEIYDGAEPHHPRGCIAQAWSIAEVLRVLHENPALSE